MAGPTSGTAATGKSSQRPMALGDGVGWSRSALPLPLSPLSALSSSFSPLSPPFPLFLPPLPPSLSLSAAAAAAASRREKIFLALGRACTALGAAGRALGGVGSIWRAPGGLRRALGGRQGRSRGVGWRWAVLPGVGSAGGDEVGRGGLFDLPPGAVGWGARRIRAGGKVFGSQQKA